MKNGVWVGGLILSLGAWAPPIFGQDSTWRPPSPPQPVSSTALKALEPCPAVTLGKPVADPGGTTPEAQLPLRQASFLDSATNGRPGQDGSEWTDQEDKTEKGSDFAIDRTEPAPVARVTPIAPGLRLAGLADGTPNAIGIVIPALATTPSTDASAPVAEAPQPVQYPVFYLSGEYLLWWLRQDKVPVLASTSSNPFDNGELGRPTTQVLFGGGGLDGGPRSGFRMTGGWWLDETCKDDAIEVSGFYLSPRRTDFNANSAEFPVLARPFLNINQNVEFSQLTAFPGISTGNLSINDESKFFGGEINGRCNICCGCDYRLDVIGGFRYLDLEESLSITETGLFLPGEGPPLAGDRFLVNDFFLTRNQFFGGQIGLMGDYDWGRFSIEGRVKLALGDTHQEILIDGSQVITAPNGTTQQFKGGLLALPSNIGRYYRDRFGVVPELNFNVGYQLTDHIRVFVGYDGLYWNDVVRPGGQIDRRLDITQIPNFLVQGGPGVIAGQTLPSAPRGGSDFWAQGATAGLEIRY
jgi:hypothetical protein